MPLSRSEMATYVLRDLGLVGADETPSSADLEWAKDKVQSVVLLLAAKGIGVWNGSEDSIPEEYAAALSARVGLSVAPSFGLSNIAEATAAMPVVEKDLRELSWQQGTSTTAVTPDPF